MKRKSKWGLEYLQVSRNLYIFFYGTLTEDFEHRILMFLKTTMFWSGFFNGLSWLDSFLWDWICLFTHSYAIYVFVLLFLLVILNCSAGSFMLIDCQSNWLQQLTFAAPYVMLVLMRRKLIFSSFVFIWWAVISAHNYGGMMCKPTRK